MENDRRPTILVVDDDPNVCDGLELSLRKYYHIIKANSAKEARGVLENIKVDVVISDHQMSGERGLDLFAFIKREYPFTGRILLTAHADMEMATQAINSNLLHQLLQKPVDMHSMLLTVMYVRELVEFKKISM